MTPLNMLRGAHELAMAAKSRIFDAQDQAGRFARQLDEHYEALTRAVDSWKRYERATSFDSPAEAPEVKKARDATHKAAELLAELGKARAALERVDTIARGIQWRASSTTENTP